MTTDSVPSVATHGGRFWKTMAVAAIILAAVAGAAVLALLGPLPWQGSSRSSPAPVASSYFVGPGVSFRLERAEADGLTITVDGVVHSGEVNIAKVVWDWGDDTVEESWFPGRHTYAQPGRYTLTVDVYDDQGTKVAGQSGPIEVTD